jgi:hypothetical protein
MFNAVHGHQRFTIKLAIIERYINYCECDKVLLSYELGPTSEDA